MRDEQERRPGTREPEKAAGRRAGRGEAGYTLLLALFIAAVMIIAASAAVPNLILQGRRQKEKLMIWRGEQYARAIGLYYGKTGHFPHDLRELEHGVNGIHFLRQAYKDPMSADGSWRLIYLGAGGQMVGSLCWRTLAEYQAAEMGTPLLSSSPNPAASSGGFGKPKAPVVPTCAMFGEGPSVSFEPQVIHEGGMIGGNLIGVGGEVDKPSVKNYMGADKYRYWEFIWNPQKGVQLAAPTPTNPTGSGAPNNPKSPVPPGTSTAPSPFAPPSSPTPTSPGDGMQQP